MGAPAAEPAAIGWGSGLLKRIGGDGALQLVPDVGRITRRRGRNHDAPDGAVLYVAGHLMELVVTAGRDVIIDDARSQCRCRSDRLHCGVLVHRDGVVAEQVGKTECGPVPQGLVTLMGSDIEIAEVGPGRVAKGNRQRARIAVDPTEPRRRGQRSETGNDSEPGPSRRWSG
jgi:hypothetical protein